MEVCPEIDLETQITIGGVWGGGRTDAAALLALLKDHAAVEVSTCEVNRVTLRLFCDVAFLLSGVTTLVRGIGEKIRPLPAPPFSHFVLINPNIHISSADMYHKWDDFNPKPKSPGPTPKKVFTKYLGPNEFKSLVMAQHAQLQ